MPRNRPVDQCGRCPVVNALTLPGEARLRRLPGPDGCAADTRLWFSALQETSACTGALTGNALTAPPGHRQVREHRARRVRDAGEYAGEPSLQVVWLSLLDTSKPMVLICLR
jgi:hypothetical protein